MIGSFWFNSFSAGGGGGGGTDYELISTTVLGSLSSSVTFSGLDTSAAAYKHLQIRATVRDNRGGFTGSNHYLRLNGDTGNNYAHHQLYGSGSSVGSGAASSQSSIYVGDIPGAGGTLNAFAGEVIDILDFASTSKYKTIRTLSGMAQAYNWLLLGSGLWMSTSAVTSVTMLSTLGSFEPGSRFSLYGLKG